MGCAAASVQCMPNDAAFFSLLFQSDMQSWEEQSQGAIYTVEYACRYKILLQAGGLCLQAEVLW